MEYSSHPLKYCRLRMLVTVRDIHKGIPQCSREMPLELSCPFNGDIMHMVVAQDIMECRFWVIAGENSAPCMG